MFKTFVFEFLFYIPQSDLGLEASAEKSGTKVLYQVSKSRNKDHGFYFILDLGLPTALGVKVD
jgi:hypothetical protein